jgi:branched-chain amino acid transport system permease protein
VIYFCQQLLNALQLGSLYALIALGYTMVYGILTMINFAHGDFFMIGAFVCFLLVTFFQLPFVPILLLSMLGVSLLGVTVERIAYRPLRQAPRLSAIITALGVGIFLENLTLAISPYPKYVPEVLPNIIWNIYGVTFSLLQSLTIGLAIILMLILNYIVQNTSIGIAMRAVSWDKNIVPLMGVSVNRIISITFALGSALGGAAGVMYALAYPMIDPYMGVMVGWKAFIGAVIGGIGDIRGAMLGGIILGAVEIFSTSILPSSYRDFVSFSLLLLLLLVRPQGIFGRARSEKL